MVASTRALVRRIRDGGALGDVLLPQVAGGVKASADLEEYLESTPAAVDLRLLFQPNLQGLDLGETGGVFQRVACRAGQDDFQPGDAGKLRGRQFRRSMDWSTGERRCYPEPGHDVAS